MNILTAVTFRPAALLAATFALAVPAAAQSPLVELRVYPADVQLNASRDRQSYVVQAVQEDGITRDVTAEAQVAFGNAALVRHENHVLYPAADGATEMTVNYGGKSVTVPVTVAAAAEDRPVSFRLDVMPVFMKSGCNMGSCHGAARGKDGFRLSLFGFDPEGDYHRLTREISGRRINLAVPEASLMIEKSVGAVPHTGGKRFDTDSEYNQTLLRWLKAGAPNDADPAKVPTVESVELYPKNAVLDGEGATQKMTVRAKYSDGTDRDVTSLAYFMTNNETSAAVAQDGTVTAAARGEAFVMVRFGTHTVGSQFIVLPKGLQFAWPNPPANNYVDELVNAKLRKLRMTPSEVCSDEEFLRRAFIDVIGKLPTVEEYNAFMADASPDKRPRLIDDLLGRKEFTELWVMKWAELLAIRSSNEVSYKSANLYYNWLQERIADNTPMDKMVRELLGSKGGTFTNPATNYYQIERETLKTAENVAQVFMGMRVQCAQCHNHPFDRWTMDDYYGFAAFFSQIGRKRGEDPRELIIFNSGGGEVKHPVGGRVMAPKFLGGATPDLAGRDRREVLADWLASKENPYFATNLANIVWAHFLGQGIIDPVDDVRVSNPASNPELLEALGKKFTEYDYDFKRLVKDICTSLAYQRATKPNETNAQDTRNFAKADLRRMRAEVMLDSISEVTDTKDKFRGLPLGARAAQIADGNTSTYFLTTFGRATRTTVCSCEVKVEPNLSQALHLLNGDTVNGKVQQGGVVARLLKEGKAPRDVLTDLTIRCLSRKPTDPEYAALDAAVAAEGAKPQQVLEDYFWALLNSREFLFNH
jgi:hypothetical protein